MSSPEIKELFDSYRLPRGAAIVPFLLYLPFGILLAILRIFIGLHAVIVSSVLPKMSALRRFVLRGMCLVLGIVVTHEGKSQRSKEAKVMVANYTSLLDHLAIELAIPNVVPNVWGFSSGLSWLLGYKDMGASEGKANLLRNARKHLNASSVPLLAFPEGSTTNGNAGLLKFSSWPFSLDQKIQPILIQINRPFFTNLPVSVLGGSWLVDIMWFLIVPFTKFKIRICPTHAKEDSESEEEFAARLQQYIAAQKSISATTYTYADKKEFIKKKSYTSSYTRAPGGNLAAPSGSSHYQQRTSPLYEMARQVKDVLPHVPTSVIMSDLEKTNDVDVTISNILEGKIKFTPEGDRAQPTHQEHKPSPSPSTSKEFGKSTNTRHLSLEERKKALIENARRTYLEKHMKH